MVSVHRLSVKLFLSMSLPYQAGDRDLLVDVDWSAMPGHRVGLVGANGMRTAPVLLLRPPPSLRQAHAFAYLPATGCGKSTLLRCLCGQRNVNNGRLVVGTNVEVQLCRAAMRRC